MQFNYFLNLKASAKQFKAVKLAKPGTKLNRIQSTIMSIESKLIKLTLSTTIALLKQTMHSLSIDCKFRIKSCSFVGESTIPESLRSVLHPDAYFSPKLSFIDLAGSERGADTMDGDR